MNIQPDFFKAGVPTEAQSHRETNTIQDSRRAMRSIPPLLMVGASAHTLLFFPGNCSRRFTVITRFLRELCSGVKGHNGRGTCEARMSEPGEETLEKAGTDGGLLFMVVLLVRSQRTGLRSPASSNPRRRA